MISSMLNYGKMPKISGGFIVDYGGRLPIWCFFFFQAVSAGVGFKLGLSCDLPGKGSNEQSMTFIRFRCYLNARA